MKGFRRAILLCLMIGGTMLLAGQATAAASPVRFGANLSNGLNPNEAYPGRTCDSVITGGNDTYSCTWIMDNAYGTAGSGIPGSKAPKDGQITKLRLIAGHGGSFRLFLAKYNNVTQQGKVVRAGPVVSYNTDPCSPGCHIQTITLARPLTVHKGERLAIKTNKTSTLRCGNGSDHTSVYKPPLAVGGPTTDADETDGCYLLLQAQY